MSPYWPSPIVVLAALVALALPVSAVFGLLAWKAFDLLVRPRDAKPAEETAPWRSRYGDFRPD